MAKGDKASVGGTLIWDVYLIELASRVGVFGAVIIALLTLFIVRGTGAQHREFIDKFFLLKWNKDDYYYQYFIITGLIILFFAQYFYYKQQIKLKSERITELINERNMLRHKLLKKHS
jgi:hypothetical protein